MTLAELARSTHAAAEKQIKSGSFGPATAALGGLHHLEHAAFAAHVAAEQHAKRMEARDIAYGPCPYIRCIWPHCACHDAEYDTKRVMAATNYSLSRLLVIGIVAFDIILAIWMRWKGYL